MEWAGTEFRFSDNYAQVSFTELNQFVPFTQFIW